MTDTFTLAKIRQDEYPATDELQCVTIYMPDGNEFKALLAGMLRQLYTPRNYEDAESAQTDGLCDIWQAGYDLTDWEGCVTPEQTGNADKILISAAYAQVLFGNPFAFNPGTNMGGYCFQNTAAATDAFQFFGIKMRPGEWEMKILNRRTASSAKATIEFNYDIPASRIAVAFQSDWYNATSLDNHFETYAFTVVEDTTYSLTFFVDTRRAAATGWNLFVTSIELTRTGD